MPSSRRRVVALPLLALTAAVAALAPAAGPALAAPCGTGATSLENGGFETPSLPPDTVELFPEADVPPWRTTDDLGAIELWGDTFLGVPAHEGTTFAELNANSPGTLYQDIVTTPGATMTWTLHHRGRDGADAMRVLIGDAATADVYSDDGWDSMSGALMDDTSGWGAHSDSYLVPEGQTCTRFAFRAVSTATGDATMGNLLDGIEFVTTIPAAPSPKAKPPKKSITKLTPPPTDTLRSGRGGGGDAGGTVLVVAGLIALAGAVGARRRIVAGR